jgi:DNA-binding MarR family transcriptional regulator
MPGQRRRYFDDNSEPIERRISTGLHKLGLAMKHRTWRDAAEDGLSPTQGQILVALAQEPLTGTELSGRLGVTLPTVSDSVRVLVEKGFVDRKPDPRHPRASLITLTGAGRRRARRASAWPAFMAAAVSTLSTSEQSAFLSGLLKMIRMLQEDGQIPTSRMCVTCVHFRPDVHEGAMPHHCAFVDAPMAGDHLRVDCEDHDVPVRRLEIR